MRQELLASQKSGRGILLDPRTKLALLITISVFVLSGGIGVNSRQFAPVFVGSSSDIDADRRGMEGVMYLFCLVRWQLSTANTVTPVLVRTAKFFCCCSLWLFNEVCSGNYDGIHYSQNNHRQ